MVDVFLGARTAKTLAEVDRHHFSPHPLGTFLLPGKIALGTVVS
jgi:hypothetical protein